MSIKVFLIFQTAIIAGLLSLLFLGGFTLKDILSPIAIVISSVGAVYVASRTLLHNTKINVLNITIDKIDKNYPIRNEYYASGVKKIAQILGPIGKSGDELTFEELSSSVSALTKEEHSKIKELLNFYNDIARGIERHLYDENWVNMSLSGAHISVWIECWPIVKWHQKLDDRMQNTYDIKTSTGITPMYYSYEKWIKSLLKDRNIYQMPDKHRVNHTVELIKNTA